MGATSDDPQATQSPKPAEHAVLSVLGPAPTGGSRLGPDMWIAARTAGVLSQLVWIELRESAEMYMASGAPVGITSSALSWTKQQRASKRVS
jgi:hypothetical protein